MRKMCGLAERVLTAWRSRRGEVNLRPWVGERSRGCSTSAPVGSAASGQAFAAVSPKIGFSSASVGGGVSRLTTTSRPIEMIAAG